ncbi:winged helix-turn-helix domain-containing protein [Bryobacter aggregatus]|uniref:winged helix-turn-helix domain-containing protein n=1 Tax=Bryobacter aggregatus TaxID=360054 RepID=UPI00068CFD5D|nr:winged helix-turn-helix domain-containing protein [Bryobacter aggregatus]
MKRSRDHIFTYGPIQLTRETRRVTVDGSPVGLTATEFRLLETLLADPDVVFSRDQLLRAAWPSSRSPSGRAVDICIRRIRLKLASHPVAQSFLQTVRGFGYSLAPR